MPAATPARHILALAVPAFFTLVAEPLLLLADTAIVGHLGTAELAGLGVASASLLTAVNLFVFLAYATTSLVARRVGAGQRELALAAGIDGLWLAAGLGLMVSGFIALCAAPLCGWFDPGPQTLAHAVVYLRISALGIPGMLVVLAASGVLRGIQDTRTPLLVAIGGCVLNLVLNLGFVLGLGWGIAGSAWGTVLAQTAMGAALACVVVRQARRHRARLRPHPGGVLRAASDGVPLFVRTLALRAAVLATTWVAAGLGDVPLAAHQVAMTVFTFTSFALDALAIAGQSLIGTSLGAGDLTGTRATTRVMMRWGLGSGIALGAVILAVHRVLPPLFTPDPPVQEAISTALVVLALVQPISGVVFVLDGVLMGAGDGSALAIVQVAVLMGYLPLLALVHRSAFSDPHGALRALWWSFAAFMALRLLALGLRARGDRWLQTGALGDVSPR